MIQQNTPEWLEMRRSYLGASDAPKVLGLSPWTSPFQLWEEKLGLGKPQFTNFAMQRGHDMEPIARQAYIDHTLNVVEPMVLFHPDKKFMMASCDGVSEDKKVIVEIKCPGERDHKLASQGIVPEHYYAQLQHQLAVIGLNKLDYFSYRDDSFYLIEVARDEAFINELYKKEAAFWDMVQTFTPPPVTEKDFKLREDDKWSQTTEGASHAFKELAKWKKKADEFKKNIKLESGGINSLGCGIKTQKIFVKGKIDYSSIPELKNVDLEKYRSPPTESWRITNI